MRSTTSTKATRLAAAGLAAILTAVPAAAQQPEREPAQYTAEQADGGLAAYQQQCASCHGENLDDGPFAPPLRGIAFRAKWYSRSVEALFTETVDTMPQDRPDSLGDETYTDLIAFLLQENGIEAGPDPLPADPVAMAALSPGWGSGGGGLSAGVALPPVPVRRNPLDGIRPVTDAMLEKPDAGDWLLWRRTYDASGYSPLRQITPRQRRRPARRVVVGTAGRAERVHPDRA